MKSTFQKLVERCTAGPIDVPAVAELVSALTLYDLPRALPVDSYRLWKKGVLSRDEAKKRLVDCSPSSISSAGKIRAITFVETRQVSITGFILPQGARLPLHDHPHMTVVCKVMHGSMHVKSFDWVDESLRIAKVVMDQTVSSDRSPLIILPNGGGVLHEFTAVKEPVLFFDVITPPYYHPPENIPCTYLTVEGGIERAQLGEVVELRPMTPQPEVPMDCFQA